VIGGLQGQTEEAVGDSDPRFAEERTMDENEAFPCVEFLEAASRFSLVRSSVFRVCYLDCSLARSLRRSEPYTVIDLFETNSRTTPESLGPLFVKIGEFLKSGKRRSRTLRKTPFPLFCNRYLFVSLSNVSTHPSFAMASNPVQRIRSSNPHSPSGNQDQCSRANETVRLMVAAARDAWYSPNPVVSLR